MDCALNSSKLNQIGDYISLERLNGLTHKDAQLELKINRHQICMKINANLLAILGLIEISVINSLCSNLYKNFNTSEILKSTPSTLNWHEEELNKIKQAIKNSQRTKYAKIPHSQKKNLDKNPLLTTPHKTKSKLRQKNIIVSEQEILTQLTFYFWKRLFSSDYEEHLWKRSLKYVFPNKNLSRSQIAEHLEVLYQARNRVAHHEFMYGARLKKVLLSIEFIAVNLLHK